MGESTDGIIRLGADPPREEWLFTGRRAVLERILGWIHQEAPGAFVVTGSAGSGKSAVVERIVALSDAARRQALLAYAPLRATDPDPGLGAIDAAVHLRGMGTQDLATVLAERLQLPAPENPWQLVESVARMPFPPVLVFDGLDEAIPEQATRIVTNLLVPLSVLASVVLATRYQEFGWRQPPSGPAAAAGLGELFGGQAAVVDLDAEPGTREDIERYVVRRLHCAGQADLEPGVAPLLADRAAAQPGGFLYARTVVAQIVRGVIDARAPGWEGQLAATTVGALEYDLAGRTRVRDGMKLPDAARDLLRALAWAMGRGMPRRGVWEAAATALNPDGVEYGAADLDWALEHYGCYIVEDRRDGEVVYRLAHREFVEHLVASSPDIDGRAAGQALVEALIVLAHRQTTREQAGQTSVRSGDEPDLSSSYLRRYLPRHAARGGPTGVAALRGLAAADPDSYLPGLAVALNDFAAYLLTAGDHEAALIATGHAVETYRALVDADPGVYLPGLAAVLSSLAAQHGAMSRHEVALVSAREAVDIHLRLTETSPEVYFTHLVTSLKNLTCHLAALDRLSVAVDIYTGCVEVFASSPACRDALIIERAGFHLNHGDASIGLRELVTLLTLDDGRTPDAIVLAARNVLRGHRLRDYAAVNRVWRVVTRTDPPDWLALTAAQISLVTEWILISGWAASRDFCAAHAEELLDRSTDVVLGELALVEPVRVELHRQLLAEVRERGLAAAYRPLLLRDLLMEWIKLVDWQDSASFALEHAADLLTLEAESALIHLGDPLGILVHLVLLRLARRDGIEAAYACVTDRQMAADRMRRALAEVEPDPIAELAALEGQVFGERFISAAHLAVAGSLMGEVITDYRKLEELAEQADPVDRQRVAAEIADLVSRLPDRTGFLAVLPQILRSAG